jgi:hypothetical protein
MADEDVLRSASARKVVHWYVHDRSGQLKTRRDSPSLHNGRILTNGTAAVRNRRVTDSVNDSEDVEDEIEGPESFYGESPLQRRITAPLGASANGTNGHVNGNGDVHVGLDDELPLELMRVIKDLTSEFEQLYEEVSVRRSTDVLILINNFIISNVKTLLRQYGVLLR